MVPRTPATRLASVGCTVLAVLVAGCLGDEGDLGVSARVDSLTVGGYVCPTHGEIAGRTRPADNLYYLTTFGGGTDTQPTACGGVADGRWLYIADSWRFACGAHVRVSNPHNNRSCVTQVTDVGPNICVEQAAGRPVIDASPMVARYLYDVSGAGWSDHVPVLAVAVANSTPLGCSDAPPPVMVDAGTHLPDAAPSRDAAAADHPDAYAPPVDAVAPAVDVPRSVDVASSDATTSAVDAIGRDVADVSVDAIADGAALAPDAITGGCACAASEPRRSSGLAALLSVGLALAVSRRRRVTAHHDA